MIFPLSLIFKERLNTDSIKSPTIAARAVIRAKITIFKYEPAKISGNINLIKQPKNIEPAIPPKNPTMLFLGLAAINPLLFFPNKTPNNHAAESHKKTKTKNKEITYLEFSTTVNLCKNEKIKPQ